MVHLWVRAEERDNERRVGILPQGVRDLIARGFAVTVEDSDDRILPIADFAAAGATIAPRGSWRQAPADALIFGLKELPADGSPLHHRHILFGHAFKGQHAGRALLDRFRAGGGTLYDLEYLVDETGRRVAAFGYWAGYAGAAVSLFAWAAQHRGAVCAPVTAWNSAPLMLAELQQALLAAGPRPNALVVGALGRVGAGATDLCTAMGVPVTKWDMAETAHGGPFPEILGHEMFFNCILARPGTPVFVPKSAIAGPRHLRVIGDIACDPDSDYNPIPLYDRATSWAEPVVRVADKPPLDIMAIDNLPSLLPLESSEDFADQLLPHLAALDRIEEGVWGRAEATFRTHLVAD
ncbi:saccharopine dehydrogenase [Thalassococcus sp. CAU 1522]|uniref:Saccharopine dehydrogenase [NAD(+), L-lysine-forming] n=1 Tax=Thalassococcus arenae TaxID=2851652 RepID=A0ABS6N808_9RHOB|nr:saccharopine dehydrogenase [Thalassococcus arenae]MBV2360155.1 saccharopine dehydrogenase [Thalassococcus arenae]